MSLSTASFAEVETQTPVDQDQFAEVTVVPRIDNGPLKLMLREGDDDGGLLDDLFGYLDRYFLDRPRRAPL